MQVSFDDREAPPGEPELDLRATEVAIALRNWSDEAMTGKVIWPTFTLAALASSQTSALWHSLNTQSQFAFSCKMPVLIVTLKDAELWNVRQCLSYNVPNLYQIHIMG